MNIVFLDGLVKRLHASRKSETPLPTGFKPEINTLTEVILTTTK
ncbi:hypothetical protein [Flavobacterium sp. W21_SRS_FM6]